MMTLLGDLRAASFMMTVLATIFMLSVYRKAFLFAVAFAVAFMFIGPVLKPSFQASETAIGFTVKFALWPAEYDAVVFWIGFWITAALVQILRVLHHASESFVSGGCILIFGFLALCAQYAIATAETFDHV